MNKRSYPTVVLIGRTNVGKSTLFNRIAKDAKSIVYDQEGVTRDVIKDIVEWQGKSFELIDSGGIGFSKKNDFITQEIRKRTEQVMADAQLILFMCDGQIGIVPEDRHLAKTLHKLKTPTLLVVNKIDTKQFRNQNDEFRSLGFERILYLSSLHGQGVAEILEYIVSSLPSEITIIPEQAAHKVVILGKPNVGKSSLLNLLVKQERAIVSDIPGTTREPIAERVTFYQQDILLTDTAGVRRKSAIDDPLEELMAKSTLQAVKQADVVLLMIDAHEGQIADQELKLAFFAFASEHKAVIILFNKADLMVEDAYAKQTLHDDIEKYDFLIKKVEKLSLSCKTGQNVGKILPFINRVYQKLVRQFSIEELTLLFKAALERTPLFWNKQRLILHRAQQIKTSPHIIALYVNVPEWFGDTQKLFFENIMRKEYDLTSVPVKIVARKR